MSNATWILIHKEQLFFPHKKALSKNFAHSVKLRITGIIVSCSWKLIEQIIFFNYEAYKR